MKALIVIAQDGYQDQELERTCKALEERGFQIILTSEEVGECRGKFGGRVQASVAMHHVQVTEYDVVAFIGGPGAEVLASHSDALQLAHEAYKENIPLGAICIAPTILAKARVLEGKRATVFETKESIEILHTYGAEYTGDPVTVDGNIVTGNGPEAAEEFGRTLASM